MKKTVAAISALLLAPAAHAQINQAATQHDAQHPAATAPATAPAPAPAQPTNSATGATATGTTSASAAETGNTNTAIPSPPASEPPVRDTNATQGTGVSAAAPPPATVYQPGAPATPAPIEAAPAPVEQGPRPAPAGPMKIETPNATLKFGFLLQPQFESVGHAALNGMSNNIFVRRTRIILGATLFKNFEFFFDSDFANLFRAVNNTNTPAIEPNNKATPGMNVQDAFATAKFLGDAIKLDIGYMLPPGAHNAMQGATSLYSWDYFTNSFRHSNVFQSSADPIGRDAGVELRGLVLNDIIEYRVGLFQGKRDNVSTTEVSAHNMFRAAGRLQINLLDPETGFFYAGTYLGAKRILSLGVSYDFQDDYRHSSGDAFLDMPLGPGVITAQADVSHWNGGSWVNLPRQTALMGEAGYLINAINLSPIARYEQRWVDNAAPAVAAVAPDEIRVGGGLAFWPYGHNINVKAFYTRVMPTPSVHDYNQVNVQAQFFIF